ncbi:MAG TPA: dicarboxylate/amino acid:cation symporter [Gemmatimonadaceae bacterium]|nr:dicarboxylate/amino acid:cation symporter [Gemmatimonadaceae bacterium]
MAAAEASPSRESPPPRRGLRRFSVSQWILISMVIGIIVGWLFPESGRAAGRWSATDLAVLSTLFLRMIKSLIVPLLFSTLVVGIAGHGDDMASFGRLAGRSIIYFMIGTTMALIIGALAATIVRPGEGVDLMAASAEAGTRLASTRLTFSGILEGAIPQSFFEAAVSNRVLQIVFWTTLFGISLALLPPGPAREFMIRACESLSAVMFKFVGLVMLYAPIGIGAAIAVTVSAGGLSVLKNLGLLVLTLYAALIVFVLLVFLPAAKLARVPLRAFWRAAKEPWLIAFTSASSDAALPLALQRMEQLGVPRRIVSFVLPTGTTFNLTGTTLFLALASVFAAQAAGIPMPAATLMAMMATLMLMSKGVPAVPRASLVILSVILVQFEMPLQAVAVIMAVDALMDMARTSVNMLGNCLATVVMARWEGEFDDLAAERFRPSDTPPSLAAS